MSLLGREPHHGRRLMKIDEAFCRRVRKVPGYRAPNRLETIGGRGEKLAAKVAVGIGCFPRVTEARLGRER